MNKEIVCIVCPMGCRLSVELEGGEVQKVEGSQCKRGKKYAAKEVLDPARVLTTTVRTGIPEFPLLPVRSEKEIPKDRLMDCMTELAKIRLGDQINIGQTVVENILGLGVDIISCRTLPCWPNKCPSNLPLSNE